jgi:hypothetical protein
MSNNLALKVISFLAAVGIWVAVMIGGIQQRQAIVPIKLLNLPEDLAVAGDSPHAVAVKLEGRGLEVLRFRLAGAHYEVNAAEFRYGNNPIELDRRNLIMVGNPQGVDFVGNRRIVIVMDWIRQQKKPVSLQFESAKDRVAFQSLGYRVEPSLATLRGPERLLSSLDKLSTVNISRSMLKGNQIEIGLQTPPEGVELLTRKVYLTNVKSTLTRRTLPLIPIVSSNAAGFDLVPQNVTVVVEGKPDMVNNLSPADIVVRPLSTPLREGEMLDLTFDTPSGIAVVDYTPQKVQAVKHDPNSRR